MAGAAKIIILFLVAGLGLYLFFASKEPTPPEETSARSSTIVLPGEEAPAAPPGDTPEDETPKDREPLH